MCGVKKAFIKLSNYLESDLNTLKSKYFNMLKYNMQHKYLRCMFYANIRIFVLISLIVLAVKFISILNFKNIIFHP